MIKGEKENTERKRAWKWGSGIDIKEWQGQEKIWNGHGNIGYGRVEKNNEGSRGIEVIDVQ